MHETLKKTPLYDRHVALGARVIDFGGWAMPVQYTSILEEHKNVRERAGIFDVSHMGEVIFSGSGAEAALRRLFTNNIGKLADGRALYTVCCLPDGGIIDDCIVYRERADRFMVIINAGNIDKDVRWFHEQADALCDVQDISNETALLAVQGPAAVALVASLSSSSVANLPSFAWLSAQVAGIDGKVCRTGYTGEDGVEIVVAAEQAAELWDKLLMAGALVGLKPIGLGARDTLRLEAKLCLYGNDIDEQHTPLEAGLGWVVKGQGFIGQEALAAQAAAGVKRKLVGLVMQERGIARHGYEIFASPESTEAIGVVTSGTVGPTVGQNIAMGYVMSEASEPGTEISVDCRGKRVKASIISGPFYRRKAK